METKSSGCRDENDDSKVEAEPSSGKLVEVEQKAQPAEPPKQDYIHVRARRGQATDSHSLAERFLSMKLEAVNSRMNPAIEVFPLKDASFPVFHRRFLQMLLDLFSYPKTDDQMAIQEVQTRTASVLSFIVVPIIILFSLSVPNSNKDLSLTPVPIAEPAFVNPATVSAPVSFVQLQDFTKPIFTISDNKTTELQFKKECFSVSSNSSFMSSAITGDGSDSNGKKASYLSLKPAPATASAEKPLLSSALVQFDDINENLSGSGNGKFGYPKRRKHRKTKVISVPAISSKISDIPSDDYTWRKYGQKRIKGSPYPRGYYKCSAVRGCPARKHVERDPDDPSMLIVTYDWEHRH
ncbi:hypothetical protein V6N13_002208 [Hibiscus sabdariffa]